MDDKKSKWHIIIDGQGAPTDSNPVVALWTQGSETFAGLAYRDIETNHWFLLNVGDGDDPVIEPDYWIEIP